MYENITEEVILKRMMDRVPDNMDKREGSIIHDALAPTAIEHQLLYIDLDTFLREVFTDRASRKYLVKRADEHDVVPHPATAAVWKASITPKNLELENGIRFNCDTMNLVVTGKVEEGVYELTCETAGSIGNGCQGKLIPINYVAGLETAELTELVTPGNNEEETEAFRKRYHTTLRKPSTSGNKYAYYNWAMACKGVGAAKIFPLAYGPGTVKVVIADENKTAATPALLKEVWEYIEEVRPIGGTITVASAEELPVNVMAKVKLKNGLNLGTVQTSFREAFDTFLKDNAFDISYVGYARVGNILLETVGVEDYAELTLNGFSHNIELTDEQIAVIGTVTLEVMG